MKAPLLFTIAMCVLAWSAPLCAGEVKPFDLTTTLGETYHGCRIMKVTPEAVTIAHKDGVAKIPFDILSDEWREKFKYDPDLAQEYRLDEERKRKEIEEKRQHAIAEQNKVSSRQMAEMAAAEKARLQWLAEQQARAAVVSGLTSAALPGSLLPLPGDPTPQLGLFGVIQTTTEIGVPVMPPITGIYTPGVNSSGQRVIVNQGTVFTPGDGSVYYVNPYGGGYVNPPIIIYPNNPPQPRVQPQPRPQPQTSTNIIIRGGRGTGPVTRP